jgi:hypothetical protein
MFVVNQTFFSRKKTCKQNKFLRNQAVVLPISLKNEHKLCIDCNQSSF